MLFAEGVRLLVACGLAFARPVGALRDPGTKEFPQMDALFVRSPSQQDLARTGS
jgi:hypothetical protein